MSNFENKNLKDVSKILNKLSHPLRLKLVLLLFENKCYVKGIGEKLNLPQATVSQHLKQLRECGIVEDNRKGNIVEYCITDPWINDFLRHLREKTELT